MSNKKIEYCELIKLYQGCLSWNESNKFKRYKNILNYLHFYLKQDEDTIKDSKNFHNFLTIVFSNNFKLPNKVYLKLKRIMKRCSRKHNYRIRNI